MPSRVLEEAKSDPPFEKAVAAAGWWKFDLFVRNLYEHDAVVRRHSPLDSLISTEASRDGLAQNIADSAMRAIESCQGRPPCFQQGNEDTEAPIGGNEVDLQERKTTIVEKDIGQGEQNAEVQNETDLQTDTSPSSTTQPQQDTVPKLAGAAISVSAAEADQGYSRETVEPLRDQDPLALFTRWMDDVSDLASMFLLDSLNDSTNVPSAEQQLHQGVIVGKLYQTLSLFVAHVSKLRSQAVLGAVDPDQLRQFFSTVHPLFSLDVPKDSIDRKDKVSIP